MPLLVSPAEIPCARYLFPSLKQFPFTKNKSVRAEAERGPLANQAPNMNRVPYEVKFSYLTNCELSLQAKVCVTLGI